MRRSLILLVAVLAWVLPSGWAAGAETEFGRYYALVVGINDYQHMQDLETAVNDASAVHDLLRREYGFESTLLLNASRCDVIRRLDALRAELTERDNLLVYYAGHGVLDRETGEGYWLPADAEEDSQANWIATHTVTNTLKALAAKHVLVVVDSCYSGTLVREQPAGLETGAERSAELRRLAQKRARKALTSGGLEPVYDGGGDGHSIFTRSLLDALREGGERIDGYQLYTQIRRSVILGAEQTPQYSDIRFAGDEGGDFLFVPTRAVVAVEEPAGQPAVAIEPPSGRIGIRSRTATIRPSFGPICQLIPKGRLPTSRGCESRSSKVRRNSTIESERRNASASSGKPPGTAPTPPRCALTSRGILPAHLRISPAFASTK